MKMNLKEFANMALGLKLHHGEDLFEKTFGFPWVKENCEPLPKEKVTPRLMEFGQILERLTMEKPRVSAKDKDLLHPYLIFFKSAAMEQHWCANVDKVYEQFKEKVKEVEGRLLPLNKES